MTSNIKSPIQALSLALLKQPPSREEKRNKKVNGSRLLGREWKEEPLFEKITV